MFEMFPETATRMSEHHRHCCNTRCELPRKGYSTAAHTSKVFSLVTNYQQFEAEENKTYLTDSSYAILQGYKDGLALEEQQTVIHKPAVLQHRQPGCGGALSISFHRKRQTMEHPTFGGMDQPALAPGTVWTAGDTPDDFTGSAGVQSNQESSYLPFAPMTNTPAVDSNDIPLWAPDSLSGSELVPGFHPGFWVSDVQGEYERPDVSGRGMSAPDSYGQ